MTTTPRTDAITQDPTLDADNEALSLAALSRRLERELAASRAECERLKGDLAACDRGQENLNTMLSDKSSECERLRALAEHISLNPYGLTQDQWATEARAALSKVQP